jgi:phosphoserine phosphatase RsbU/P
MDVQDVSQNRRIARLAQLTQELEHSHSADATVRTLLRAFADVGGFVASLFVSTRGLRAGEYRVVRVHLGDDLEGDLLDPSPQEQAPVRRGGILGTITRSREPQILQDVDWSCDTHLRDTLFDYRSVMAVPIAGDHLPMNWAILLKRRPQRFTMQNLEEAVERLALIGALLENQLLVGELARAHEKIDRDARQVGQLQRALLPALMPRIAGLEVAASYEPSGRAGGDLYDFFPLADRRDDGPQTFDGVTQRWCALIGDASGHGLAAAVMMAMVQALLHAHPAGIDGPAALLTHTNRHLCDKRIGGFFTAFLAVYEPTSRRLTYANAGHPPPVVVRSSDGSIEAFDAVVSYPLGIDDTETFNEATVQLERGDTVLLYTDGITEARDAHDEMFEEKRLRRIVRDACGGGPVHLLERLRAAVEKHQNGPAAHDDQTLVAALVL